MNLDFKSPQDRLIQKKNGTDDRVVFEQSIDSLETLKKFWSDEIATWNSSQTVIWLDGDLGAGKTTSVGAILKSFDQEQNEVLASSPTFALHHCYPVKHSLFDSIEHVDLYRIQSESELDQTGFWDLFTQNRCLIVIEWGARLDPNTIPFEWSFLRYQLKLRSSIID